MFVPHLINSKTVSENGQGQPMIKKTQHIRAPQVYKKDNTTRTRTCVLNMNFYEHIFCIKIRKNFS